ncbi:MAG TPA: hypothetical protein VF384_11950 [Planctomycetota bacterium]
MPIRTLVLTCLCICARAQETPAVADAAADLRGPALGEVRDANGKPWLAAEVVLVSRPLPHDANAGEVDRVVAKVDERGRFRASILRGRPYTAWAWGDVGADGRPASAVVDRVFAQQPIVLKQERVLKARDVVLDHPDRWEGFTFRVRVVDATWNRDVHWLDVNDGRARLPWLVSKAADVELFAVRDGVLNPILSEPVDATRAEVRIQVPEHQRVTCIATDETREPLVGAPVFRSLGDVMHRVGAIDATGKLVIDVGSDPKRQRFDTFVLADTGAMGVFSRVQSLARDDVPAGAAPDDLLCRLRQEWRVVHAIFLDDGGRPLANLEVWYSGTTVNSRTRSSAASFCTSRRTDANGTIQLPGALQGGWVNAHVLLGERDLAALPVAWRAGLTPIVFAPLAAARGSGIKEDPYVVSLRDLCPVELTFVGPGRTAVPNVEVALGTLRSGVYAGWPRRNGSGAFTDERGRIRLLVPGAQHLGLSARADLRMLVRAFETTPGRVTAEPATVTFELPAPAGIRGRLVDAAGVAVHDSVVQVTCGGEAAPRWKYEIDPPSVLEAPGNALRVLLPEDQKELRALAYLFGTQVATDAEGRFAVPLPPVAIPGLMLFNSRRGDRVIYDSRNVTWTGETIDDFEWTIRR